MNTTILLVEDEAEIRQIEADYFKQEGYSVLEASDGQEAIDMFETNRHIHALVLDLNLPQVDGISVCRHIRKQSDVPILMVTARTGEIDELVGLEVGADDYIKKPFSPKVLIARVKTLLKRPHQEKVTARLHYQDLTIELEKRKVTQAGEAVSLTSTQFNILVTLMRHPGRVFSREELIQFAYPHAIPPDIYDRTIDTHIKNIRKALSENQSQKKYIETVRGSGYRLYDEK